MDLKDTIIKQLSAPVKRKGTQDYMTDRHEDIVSLIESNMNKLRKAI